MIISRPSLMVTRWLTGPTVGGWSAPGNNEGYVGLELTDGGGTYYGWAHFIYNATNVPPNANATGTLRLIDAAIEQTHDVGIPAGKTADTGAPVIEEATFSVPKPPKRLHPARSPPAATLRRPRPGTA